MNAIVKCGFATLLIIIFFIYQCVVFQVSCRSLFYEQGVSHEKSIVSFIFEHVGYFVWHMTITLICAIPPTVLLAQFLIAINRDFQKRRKNKK